MESRSSNKLGIRCFRAAEGVKVDGSSTASSPSDVRWSC